MKKLVVFGNCQAGQSSYSLLRAISAMPELDLNMQFVDGNVQTALADLDVAIQDADILIYQGRVDFPNPPAFKGKIFRIPTMFFKSLWPFDGHDPKILESTDATPRFTRGDTFIKELYEMGMDAQDIYDTYINTDISKLTNLDELLTSEIKRQYEKDALSDVSIAPFIEKNFASQRLFSMSWHPTNLLMMEYQKPIWEFLKFDDAAISLARVHFEGHEKLQPDVPIHSSVIDHFGINWAPQHYNHHGVSFTFEDYLKDYIRLYFPNY